MRIRLALLVPCLLAALALPAGAAGTGGIEITPDPSTKDGRPVTTFRLDLPSQGTVHVPFTIRNVDDGPRTARVYAARVTRIDGSFSLDDEGSSPYVSLDDRSITLAQGEIVPATFEVQAPSGDRPGDEQYAAIVVEVRNGSVVQRASTLVYLSPGREVPLPLVAVVVAAVLLAAAGTAVGVVRRRA